MMLFVQSYLVITCLSQYIHSVYIYTNLALHCIPIGGFYYMSEKKKLIQNWIISPIRKFKQFAGFLFGWELLIDINSQVNIIEFCQCTKYDMTLPALLTLPLIIIWSIYYMIMSFCQKNSCRINFQLSLLLMLTDTQLVKCWHSYVHDLQIDCCFL